MKSVVHSAFILIVLLLNACVEKEEMCCGIRETEQLTGTWLSYERGYSPGDEYITETISATPPQELTINGGNVSSTVEGMQDLKYYRILNDTIMHAPYIVFYSKDPSTQEESSLDATNFSFDLANNILTLNFRWCNEGCHMAFRKIE